MSTEKKRRAILDSTITTDRMKILTTNPELKDKIRTNIVTDEPVFWCIRFNIPLDAKSVSGKTMNVTDTNGYIVKTEITYDDFQNLIVIMPVDDYEEDQYYLLNVTKKVKSRGGNNLKREIHIMFKLLGGQISEYQFLKSNVKVPEPVPRPKDWRIVPQKQRDETVSKFYSFDTLKKLENTPKDQLPIGSIKVNPLLALLGIALVAAGIALSNTIVLIAGIAASLSGIIYIIIRLNEKTNRSMLKYNRGVRHFNKERYEEALRLFKLASSIDSKNELSEYASNKLKFYVS